MSVILGSLLDDERRAECRANDGAMAMGRPIIAYQPTFDPVQRTRDTLDKSADKVLDDESETGTHRVANAAWRKRSGNYLRAGEP
jgi:predicted ArsR family transcriptional regulator